MLENAIRSKRGAYPALILSHQDRAELRFKFETARVKIEGGFHKLAIGSHKSWIGTCAVAYEIL